MSIHMNDTTQLLCTFTTADNSEATIDEIIDAYTLSFNKIYILENVDDPAQLVLTYNISGTIKPGKSIPVSTISVHRKKFTNTIYTINAINRLIEQLNGGVLDKTFRINWDDLRNTVLVTAHGNLKRVNTKLVEIIDC